MAHELSIAKNGEAAMAFVGQVPWHGLGQHLEEGSSIDEWAVAAGMDWEILRSIVSYSAMNNTLVTETKLFSDRHVLYRSDTQEPLSIVSTSYKIVQPREILDFYQSLVATAGLQLETAGVMFKGKRFWALANTGRAMSLAGKDEVKGYLLLSTSCDGTLATSAQFTSIRVVCNNTLNVALSDNNNRIRVPHNRVWNPEEVKFQLGFVDKYWKQFRENIEILSRKKIDRDAAAQYLIDLFGDPELSADQQSPAVADKCANIWELYKGAGVGADMKSCKDTAWGLLNAITQTIDHHTSHHTIDARLNNAWFGAGNALKTKAFELALNNL